MIFWIIKHSLAKLNTICREKSCRTSLPFLLHFTSGSRLQNSDWFIQIPGALAVCKELTRVIKRHNAIVGKAYSSSTSFHQRANFEKPVHLLNKFWDFEGGSRFLCDMLIFYARVAKSTLGEQGDLCGRGSKNTTGIYDLPVPRPLTCEHILLPCILNVWSQVTRPLQFLNMPTRPQLSNLERGQVYCLRSSLAHT